MDATVFSLEYGVPLYAYAKIATAFVSISDAAVNFRIPSTSLATPSETKVVLPNVDTLYSTAVLDLSENDVVITVPQVDANRYWNFAFYDPYGNNFANVGSVGNDSSGQYLLRRASDCTRETKYQATDKDYEGQIFSPTTYGTLLVRDLVKNNSSDITYVQNLVKQAKLTEIPRNKTARHEDVPLTNATFTSYYEAGANTPLAIMGLLAKLAPANPPFNKSDTRHVNHQLSEAGIRNGIYKTPIGANLSLAYSEFEGLIESYAASSLQSLGNGWARNEPQGTYGSNYADRALIAAIGYLELTADQVIYPRQAGQETEMTLQSNESYIYTFSSKPPIASDGFWSLTLYDSQGYLSANALDKYSVGDRSNITYLDGELVYGNGTGSADGSFQVLVQPYDVPPPGNWTSNWLPAPSNGSEFSITLRLYAPTAELKNGEWEFPVVTKGAAIVG